MKQKKSFKLPASLETLIEKSAYMKSDLDNARSALESAQEKIQELQK
jgi:hypothetical protein